MSEWMKEMERLVDAHEIAISRRLNGAAWNEETDASRAALLAHAAQRDHTEDVLDMVQSVELPEPDQVIGHGWDARSYYGADQMRTYGDAREAAGYARGRAEADKLAHTLMMCRETFRKYADLHAAKGTDEGRAKAAANMRIVSICDAALRGEVKP